MIEKMQTRHYAKDDIVFLLSKENEMQIAMELGKVYEKRLDAFLKTDFVKEFITLLKYPRKGGILEAEKREGLLLLQGVSGTFLYRLLATKFAKRIVALSKEIDDLECKAEKNGEDFERYLYLKKELNREKSLRSSLTRETLEDIQTLFVAEEGGEA